MDDLAQVKAQVKSWERSFKKEHNRVPTKADIKAVPQIGERDLVPETLAAAADDFRMSSVE